ncbi:MAG: DNA-directed RNA polymerase subunit alpha C-terminal domain-containing protein [Candidatus Absconditabacteria bacterium]
MLDTQKFIGKPKIVFEEIDDRTCIYEVQYLPKGFGHTLGNAIRRIILGYNLGGSITGLKIKGISHEYSTITGVKESVIDIMLNFKKLRFKIDESVEKLQWISQRFKGVGLYTSESLKLPAGIDLLDNGEYLFEITDPNVELIMDFRIEKGYTYYSLDYLRRREEKEESSDIGLFLIDNDFKAVDYVKYDVEEIIDDFMGGSKDKLILEVKTKSHLLPPKEILNFAGEVLSSYAKLFVFEDAYIDRSVMIEYAEMEEMNEKLNEEISVKTVPIDALPLSERTRNALIKNSILYVEDLEKKRRNELLSMKGVGRKAVEEINQALDNMGKKLAG